MTFGARGNITAPCGDDKGRHYLRFACSLAILILDTRNEEGEFSRRTTLCALGLCP